MGADAKDEVPRRLHALARPEELRLQVGRRVAAVVFGAVPEKHGVGALDLRQKPVDLLLLGARPLRGGERQRNEEERQEGMGSSHGSVIRLPDPEHQLGEALRGPAAFPRPAMPDEGKAVDPVQKAAAYDDPAASHAR